jgi:D-sedoheptulose 7-phosphate isomerase
MYINNLIKTLNKLDLDKVEGLFKLIKNKIKKKKRIYVFGNGGSATTAQHFITDWNKMYLVHKKGKIKGYCLNENIGIITAYSNDIAYEHIFSKQLESLMDKEDLAIGITTSGNSKNIINAYKTVNKLKGDFFVLTNEKGGFFNKIKKNIIKVPTLDIQVCEDVHLVINHIIMKKLIEKY